MFCSDQNRVGNSGQTATSQRKSARQCGHLFCDDAIVFQLILQSLGIFYPHYHTERFCGKRQKAFSQGFGCLGANVCLVPFGKAS